uniref:Uncharacterized protein n=1 Tax=Anguilla anguilla TaxID=7936 RepID=A0A0E9VQV9_ANGAN
MSKRELNSLSTPPLSSPSKAPPQNTGTRTA